VLPQVAKLGGMALGLLFPQRCIGCGKEGAVIYHSYRSSLLRVMPPLCPRCGSWQARVDGIRSPFRFDSVTGQAIHQLKYKNLRALAAPLVPLLNDYLITNPILREVLVPVPLPRQRLKERLRRENNKGREPERAIERLRQSLTLETKKFDTAVMKPDDVVSKIVEAVIC